MLSALKRDSKSVWPSRSIQGGFSLSYARPPQPRSPRRFEHKALAVRASPPLFSSISLHFKHDPAVQSSGHNHHAFSHHSQPAPGPFLPLFHCLSQVPFHRPCHRYQIAIADAAAALTRGKVSLSDYIVCAGAHLSHTER